MGVILGPTPTLDADAAAPARDLTSQTRQVITRGELPFMAPPGFGAALIVLARQILRCPASARL
jgi:hypothetical protein